MCVLCVSLYMCLWIVLIRVSRNINLSHSFDCGWIKMYVYVCVYVRSVNECALDLLNSLGACKCPLKQGPNVQYNMKKRAESKKVL